MQPLPEGTPQCAGGHVPHRLTQANVPLKGLRPWAHNSDPLGPRSFRYSALRVNQGLGSFLHQPQSSSPLPIHPDELQRKGVESKSLFLRISLASLEISQSICISQVEATPHFTDRLHLSSRPSSGPKYPDMLPPPLQVQSLEGCLASL